MIWSISAISRWLEWRRRDRIEVAIATSEYTTNIVNDDGSPTGKIYAHVVVFFRDGNGVRYSRVETSGEAYADTHAGVCLARMNWRIHGDLPSDARYCSPSRTNLTVISGGAA